MSKPSIPPSPAGAAAALLLCLAALLGGCASVSDHLTIRADGSGEVLIEVVQRTDMDEGTLAQRSGAIAQMPQAVYPPLSEQEAKALFPDHPGVKVSVETVKDDKGRPLTRTHVTFADVNWLLETPYAQARALSVVVDAKAGKLIVKSLTGLAPAACGMEAEAPAMTPPDQAETFKKLRTGFVATYQLTLPGPAASEDGKVEGDSVRWVFDLTDPQQGKAAAADLRKVLTASADAKGITFTTTRRELLSTQQFDQVVEGALPQAGPKIDIEAVKKDVRFVPVRLTTVRHIDLAGSGAEPGNAADNGVAFTAAVTYPADHKPMRIGAIEVLEATSGKGKSLLVKADPAEEPNRRDMMMNSQQDDAGPDSAPPQSKIGHRIVQARLALPDYGDTTIRVFRGKVELVYPGPSVVVRLPQAVKSIVNPSNPEAMMMGGGNNIALDNATLKSLGVEAQVQMAMEQSGALQIMLALKGPANVKQAQVFDKDGKPWPTMLAPAGMGGGNMTTMLIVWGKPQAPLSMAMVLDGGGPKIELPVELHDVSMVDDEK